MSNFIGRGPNSGPGTDFFPLSGSTASAPSIALTATTATGAQIIHTADAAAQDVLYVTVSNNTSAAVTVFGLLGATATTSAIPLSVAAGGFSQIFNGNATISKAGTLTMYATTAASAGLTMYGFVARTYTATS